MLRAELHRAPRRELFPRDQILGWIGCLLIVLGCSDPSPRPANVLMVVFDTTRYDDVFGSEDRPSVTPTIDSLAKESQQFDNAMSLYSVTIPSHISLFTGSAAEGDCAPSYPRFAAGRSSEASASESRVACDHRASSLFTILGAHGYRTYAFAGNENIRRETLEVLDAVDLTSTERPEEEVEAHYESITRQYGIYVPREDLKGSFARKAQARNRRITALDAEWVNGQALGAMHDHAREHGTRPFFLFVNYNDAHDPYWPVAPWDRAVDHGEDSVFDGDLWSPSQRRGYPALRGLMLALSKVGLLPIDLERARALHLGALAYADDHLGRLMAGLGELGLLDSTIVVVTADHGEAFGESGRMAHGAKGDARFDRVVRHVPLLMRFPGEALAPARFAVEVDLRDVKPTLLDWLGFEDESSRGRSLLPLMSGTVQTLAKPAPRPSDRAPDSVGENRVEGQGADRGGQLERRLRALGYIE